VDTKPIFISPPASGCTVFDLAQNQIGLMCIGAMALYNRGCGIAHDDAESLRRFKLAAAQGLVVALYSVALFYEKGWSVAADKAEAICWFKRADAAGYSLAAAALKRLGA